MAYETGWQSIIEFQSGREVSDKLNTAFFNIDKSFIGLEEADTSLDAKIDALALVVNPFYIYTKVVDVNVQDTWTDVCTVEAAENPHATFEYKLSTSFTLDTAIHSALFRFSIDGGSNWDEITLEPSDATNKQSPTYFFPKDVLKDAGLSLILQARKEDAADVMMILYADVIIEKKINLS